MKKVAVITRTKDRPTLLKRAIESVRSQTFTDYVHVIINDGGAADVVEAVLDTLDTTERNRIKVIHNTVSNGMEAATNKAIRAVESTYVAIHDDDDSWHPEFLERTIGHLTATNARGTVVRTDKITEEMLEDGSVRHIRTSQWLPHVQAINLYRQCIDNQMTPITFVYARSVLDDIGYYDESLPVCGDWDFGIRFLQKYDVEYLDPGFALARYHHRTFKPGSEGNTSYAGNDRARYYSNLLMNKYLREELAEGRLGVGYIMSKLRYDESRMAQIARKLLPGFVSKKLKGRIGN